MTRLACALLLVVVTGCSRPAPDAAEPTAGRDLELAAQRAGLIGDARDAAGVYAAGDDRVCVVRLAGRDPRYTIGVSVDYGAGQRCIAHGGASGGDALTVDLGRGCRFTATRDGDRLAFPTQVPDACSDACQGRATLDALAVERLSTAAGEAARLRGGDGELLCGT